MLYTYENGDSQIINEKSDEKTFISTIYEKKSSCKLYIQILCKNSNYYFQFVWLEKYKNNYDFNQVKSYSHLNYLGKFCARSSLEEYCYMKFLLSNYHVCSS